MISIISMTKILYIFFALLITASVAQAQAVYPAQASETITVSSPNGNQTVTVVLPRRAIQPTEVALIVNNQDSQSLNVAAYYRQVRNIPAENVIEVSFPAGSTSITQPDFEVIKAQVDTAVNALPDIQALVITWTEPWMVKEIDTTKGMSITSAFALGFHIDYYNDTSQVCEATRETSYYNTDSVRPFNDFGLRPAMMLAGTGEQNVIDLIDKAVASDQSFPEGDGYFIRTTDVNRSDSRFRTFINTFDSFNRTDALAMNYIDNSAGVASGNYLSNTPDVLFYFTGLAAVPEINTNGYAAGAVADHLTSFGGRLTGPNGQMSALRWLEAGAIASYGTVIEPCNFAGKFTHTTNFVSPYFSGATVLEAYWKSIRSPGEGVFVGDPLTRPFGSKVTVGDEGVMSILTTILLPGKNYTLLEAGSADGPFTIVQSNIEVDQLRFATITQNVDNSAYILAEDLADNILPNTPLLFLPADGNTDLLLSPELQAYGLAAGTTGDIHSETHWQISKLANDFSTDMLVLDATSDSQLTTFIVPDHIFDINSTYFWRAKFHYESGAQSEWSLPFSLTTVTSDETDQDMNGIPDNQEINDPNLDMDADGTPDISQMDMKSVKSAFADIAVGVQAGANTTAIESLSWIDPDTIVDLGNRPEDLPVGLINFKISVNSPGASAEVVVYFSQPAPADAQWYQYNPLIGWQDYSIYANFSADRKSVTLAFTDGGIGDIDGAANGVIVDPSGISTTTATGDGNDPITPDDPNDTPGGSDPTAPDDPNDTPGGNDPAPDDTNDTPGSNDPATPDDPNDKPGGAAEPATTSAASSGGGGGGCLISTAGSGYHGSQEVMGIMVFFGSLLIGLKGFSIKDKSSQAN
jgi:uncharacterized protein (TIGR03790 family)